ncbi:hypothetical protein [Serratia microhaemolytica]|uniref:hypothetical protein n=1 Tax=Serratia microhaemolytica TaxID=2675110 RepID=UPI000FDE59CA|nr:hypothetical protein [Serratia microhaemolytica]
MSEYRSYRFERLEGYLTQQQQQELSKISSRAEVNRNFFTINYSYSDFELPIKSLMWDYFDIGFYFTVWGDAEIYFKVPVGVLPNILLATTPQTVLQSSEQGDMQLLSLSLNNQGQYKENFFDNANDIFKSLASLYSELINGDYRLLYFCWLQSVANGEKSLKLPLINFDFEQLTSAQKVFFDFFSIPRVSCRALALLLKQHPSHRCENLLTDAASWVERLSIEDKNMLLNRLFKEQFLSLASALSLTSKNKVKSSDYEFWLTAEMLGIYLEQAERLIAQEKLEEQALRLELERIDRENKLNQIYAKREASWRQAEMQVLRSSASGYEKAAFYLHELSDAYQFKHEQQEFTERFRTFISRHKKRSALLKRLSGIALLELLPIE